MATVLFSRIRCFNLSVFWRGTQDVFMFGKLKCMTKTLLNTPLLQQWSIRTPPEPRWLCKRNSLYVIFMERDIAEDFSLPLFKVLFPGCRGGRKGPTLSVYSWWQETVHRLAPGSERVCNDRTLSGEEQLRVAYLHKWANDRLFFYWNWLHLINSLDQSFHSNINLIQSPLNSHQSHAFTSKQAPITCVRGAVRAGLSHYLTNDVCERIRGRGRRRRLSAKLMWTLCTGDVISNLVLKYYLWPTYLRRKTMISLRQK